MSGFINLRNTVTWENWFKQFKPVIQYELSITHNVNPFMPEYKINDHNDLIVRLKKLLMLGWNTPVPNKNLCLYTGNHCHFGILVIPSNWKLGVVINDAMYILDYSDNLTTSDLLLFKLLNGKMVEDILTVSAIIEPSINPELDIMEFLYDYTNFEEFVE